MVSASPKTQQSHPPQLANKRTMCCSSRPRGKDSANAAAAILNSFFGGADNGPAVGASGGGSGADATEVVSRW